MRAATLTLDELSRPEMKPPDMEEDATVPTDLVTLVSAMGAAHTATGRPDPHSPWLPPLPELITLWTAGCFSDGACLCFRLSSLSPGARVRPRSGCGIPGLSEDEYGSYLSSIHEAISLIALSFVGYTIRWTLSFLSVALND